MSTSPHTIGVLPLPELGAPWKLVRSLGRGGIGEVFEAVHPTLGRVAVKVLLATHQDRADIVDRMRLEADVLAHLHHENIVQLYEMGSTSDGRPFYAMEYLTGASLRETLDSRGSLPSAEAVGIACEALAGLGAAHHAGILHRDVKPGNLYLVQAPTGPRVKLVDFGLAKLVTTAGTSGLSPLQVSTAKGTVLGTPRYLSPEQIAGRPVDARADLYAVGLVLYRMLVGKGPFDDIQDFADMMRAQVTVVPPFPSTIAIAVPRWLDVVVMKALAKKPEDRFATAAEFACELERGLDAGRPRLAREAPPAHGEREAPLLPLRDDAASLEGTRGMPPIQVAAPSEPEDDTTITCPQRDDTVPEVLLAEPRRRTSPPATHLSLAAVIMLVMIAAFPWLVCAFALVSPALGGKH